MGKASRTKQSDDRRARIAAQREAERRAEQRRRIYLAGGSILAVAVIVVAFVLVKLNTHNNAPAASAAPTGAALTKVVNEVTGVPASVTDEVAGGGVSPGLFVAAKTSSAVSSASSNLGSYFATVDGPPLTSGGKPEVLFMGGEYCPYCAAQRWAIVNSLSRFGTFTGLKTTHSSSTDSYPNTPSFTFYGATYTSQYINFTSVEEYTNVPTSSGGYTTLQTPTAAQQQLAAQYDPGTGNGSPIPFMDLGNKYVQVGNLSPLTPTLLANQSWAQVGAAVANPTSSLGKAEIGNANYMTAGICKLTNNLPTTACTPTIQKLESSLAS